MAAGVPPHIALDYTPRELYAVFAGRAIAAKRAYSLALWATWHGEAFARTKRLSPLADLLRKIEPARVMSKRQLRANIIGAAMAMGAKVRYVKKEDMH
jgi:hypothetical protein